MRQTGQSQSHLTPPRTHGGRSPSRCQPTRRILPMPPVWKSFASQAPRVRAGQGRPTLQDLQRRPSAGAPRRKTAGLGRCASPGALPPLPFGAPLASRAPRPPPPPGRPPRAARPRPHLARAQPAVPETKGGGPRSRRPRGPGWGRARVPGRGRPRLAPRARKQKAGRAGNALPLSRTVNWRRRRSCSTRMGQPCSSAPSGTAAAECAMARAAVGGPRRARAAGPGRENAGGGTETDTRRQQQKGGGGQEISCESRAARGQ